MKNTLKHPILLLLFFWCNAVHAQLPMLVKDINPTGSSYPDGMIAYNGKTYFSAEGDALDNELWITDGTGAGTQQLTDINPTGGSFPQNFVVCNGLLFFTADDGTHGRELWVTDGTSTGTRMVEDINAMGNIDGVNFISCNDKLYFGAHSPLLGIELWVSDGTAAGTHLVKDINPGVDASNISGMVTFNGFLFFNARDASGYHGVWKSDGTAAGTIKIKDAVYGYPFAEMDGHLYFGGIEDNVTATPHLWRIDGDDYTVGEVKQVDVKNEMIVLNHKLIFAAEHSASGIELWESDGTTGGTRLLKDIKTGPGSSAPAGLTRYHDKVYFAADCGVGFPLVWIFRTDGTEAGTEWFASLGAGNAASAVPFKVYNDKLYVIANDRPVPERQLWELNDAPGAISYKMIQPALAPNPDPCQYSDLFIANGSLYYKATYEAGVGRELYQLTTTSTTAIENDNMQATAIRIYPNPATDLVHIDAPGKFSVKLFSVDGGISVMPVEGNTINIAGMPQGIYLLHITASDNSFYTAIKLVRQ